MPPTSASPLQHLDIRVAGVRSPVLDSGPSRRAEAVVFVHGNPGSAHDWIALMNRAKPFGRAVALDMPGFGQADKPEDFAYTAGGYAEHLDGVLRQLGIQRAHLVLHDFGGPFGLTWAAYHPERVASLTLINTGVLPGYRWHYLARIWRTPGLGELFQATATRSAFHLLLKHGNPRGLPAPFVDRMFDNYDRGTRRAVLKLYRATDLGEEARILAAMLRPLDVPVLVVWGRHDPYLPVKWAERQRDIFPRARVVVLDESGHWPFADDPEGVASAVIPFLRQHVARTATRRPWAASN
jgi:pimeloyl-ACP methyl ester carboxylesterase